MPVVIIFWHFYVPAIHYPPITSLLFVHNKSSGFPLLHRALALEKRGGKDTSQPSNFVVLSRCSTHSILHVFTG